MTAVPWIDPEVASALDALPFELSRALQPEGIPALRQTMEALVQSPPPSEAVELLEIVAPGDPPVELRVHRPRAGGEGRPCVLWIHGGGLISGSARLGDAVLQEWAERFGCVGASVSYRLAPEHPYPAALDDCYAGLRRLADGAAELGIDPDAIGVAGSSAGACLAAAVALRARDAGEVALAFQLLDSPMLDDRGGAGSSRWDCPTWDRETNETAWRAYLGGLAGGDVPPTAAPARADDLSGLPPSYVSVGSADLFFDEAVEYARRLAHAGVPTGLRVWAGGVHGFETLAPGSAIAARARLDRERWLEAALSAPDTSRR